MKSNKNYIYCTYFNTTYLPKGLVLIDSLKKYDPQIQIIISCLDQQTFGYLSHLKNKQIVPIRSSVLEATYPKLKQAKPNRSTIEFFWTQTPFLCRFCLDKYHKDVVYLDADMEFYSSPQAIFNEIGKKSVAICPHRYPSYNDKRLTSGRFNVGWNFFKNDRFSQRILKTWSDDCLHSCTIDKDTCGDQKYLDKWPLNFDRIHIITHSGVDCAPWNFYDQRVDLIDSQYYVNGEPLLFFHFHGLDIYKNNILWPNISYPITGLQLKIYQAYIQKLKTNIKLVKKDIPNFENFLPKFKPLTESIHFFEGVRVSLKKIFSRHEAPAIF